MAKFSKASQEKLETCHLDLQHLFNEVIQYFDCTILCGQRGEREQNEAFRMKYSKLKFPQSRHNEIPSMAVDAAPYPINWKDRDRFYFFAGFVMGVAARMGIKIRWGGDWDSDTEVDDQTFMDWPHFELVKRK